MCVSRVHSKVERRRKKGERSGRKARAVSLDVHNWFRVFGEYIYARAGLRSVRGCCDRG